MKQNQLFTSINQAWATPQDFFEKLNDEFDFTLDPCCTTFDCKCPDGFYFDRGMDGLKLEWSGRVFVNNPYDQNKLWVPCCAEQSKNCDVIVQLIPARTDTVVFHDHIWDRGKNRTRPGVELRLIKGRLTFGSDAYWKWLWDQPYRVDTETGEQLRDKAGKLIPNPMYQKYGKKNCAPFPSMVVVYRRLVNF